MVEELENIAQIVDIDEVQAQFDLPVDQLTRLQIGTKASIDVEAVAGGPFQGAISFISPVIEPRSKTLRVKITVKNPKHLIKPGLSASARFER
jgi:multidrug efflux pump subunit AcrA (membrane-fusion protein)